MKIECPETKSIIELSDCDCGPKCEHYYDTKQYRIDQLESAMQEFIDEAREWKTSIPVWITKHLMTINRLLK